MFFLIFCNITRLYITQPRRTRDYIMWGIRECWLLTWLGTDLGRLKCFQFYKADSSGVWVFCVCKDNNNYQAILVCLSIKLANFCLLTGLSHLCSSLQQRVSMFIRRKHFSIMFAWIVLTDSVSGIRDPLMCARRCYAGTTHFLIWPASRMWI